MESTGTGPARPRFAVLGLAELLSGSSWAAAVIRGGPSRVWGARAAPKARVLEDAAQAKSITREQAGSSRTRFSVAPAAQFVGAAWLLLTPMGLGSPGQLGVPGSSPGRHGLQPCLSSPAAWGMREAPLLPAFPHSIEEAKGHRGLGILQPHQPHRGLQRDGKEPGRCIPAAPGPSSTRMGPWGHVTQVTGPAGLWAASARARASGVIAKT